MIHKSYEHVKFCVLGAGPTGLAFTRELIKLGIDSVVILEAKEEAGGLCRSEIVDGSPIDTGGGHFLDVKKQNVLSFLFELMPESEWNRFQRIAKIRFRNKEIDHPLEASIWQLGINDQIDLLESIAKAGCVNDDIEPAEFDRWIKWKFGRIITDEYMLPYNNKIWSIPLSEIGTYWMYKLPSVSFRETIRSCLLRKSTGKLSAHGEFYYPKKFGYGEVWRRMGEELGDHLRLNCPVVSLDLEMGTVNNSIKAEYIVNTIPWDIWARLNVLPKELLYEVESLKYASIDIDYNPDNLNSDAHWIYEPSTNASYHRQLLRHNFCDNAQGHWVETNAKRSKQTKGHRWHNTYAYPINTNNKKDIMKKVSQWSKGNNIIPLGRWGLWEHMNSDEAVNNAIEAARYAKTR